jgi:hypothetical protein
VPNGKLALFFYQPPCTHVELVLGLAPVVKDDLLKDFSTFIVEKVIQFDQIDLCPRNTGGRSAGFAGTCARPKDQDCRNFV